MLCKNIQDQERPVHDFTFQFMLQIVHLGRRKLIVTDDPCRIHGIHQRTNLLDLSFANVRTRMNRFPVLYYFSYRYCPCCMCQLLQFFQRFVRILVLVYLNPYQNNPFFYLTEIFHRYSFLTMMFFYYSIAFSFGGGVNAKKGGTPLPKQKTFPASKWIRRFLFLILLSSV